MVLPFYIFSEVTSLLTVRISPGVVVTVAFQQVDGSPDAKTGTERDDEGLENADSRVEKCHNFDCRNLWDEWLEISLSLQKPERKLRCSSRSRRLLSIILFQRSVPTLQARRCLFIVGIYEKPPLLRRRACALRLCLRRTPRRLRLLSEPAL